MLVMFGIAANYWLDRYALLNNASGNYYGASYTDINAIQPAKGILFGIAIVVGLLFLAVIWRGDWRIPTVGVAMMVLSALVIGGVYPAIVQNFQVDPNAQDYESEYIQRNIDATLAAYGLEDIETTSYDATTEASAEALRADAETTAQIRLLDPNIVSPAFQQRSRTSSTTTSPRRLAVDRYEVDGELSDTVIAVRELDLEGLGAENRTWVNDHTVYTHGFGVVAAYGNRTTSDGQPAFFQGGIPSVGELGNYEPRIYFGTTLPDYSVVGAPEGTTSWEATTPRTRARRARSTRPTRATADRRSATCSRRLMYAIKFGEEQIMFSDRVTSESQILYHRDPLDRVGRVAPYLEARLDHVPRGRGRSRGVGGGRLHDDRQVPLRGLAAVDRAVRRIRGLAAADHAELHAQLGQGDRGRLRRHGDALRVGYRGPAAADVGERLPHQHSADVGDLRRA
nr:UPF0182 family protein [Demequina litorisediminis]